MGYKRILLTGGSGLLGRSLARALAGICELRHLDLNDPQDGLPCVRADLRDFEAVRAACDGVDAVLHVAALHGRAWEEAGDESGFAVNVIGTKNVLEAARLAGVRKVVFTSSIWANGHGSPPPRSLPIVESMPREPAELYGLSKLLGEAMCRYLTANTGIGTIVLRPGGIAPAEAYDPADAAYLGCRVDVRDVAAAHLLALEYSENHLHQVFNITADSPLGRLEPDDFKKDPAAALETVTPGALQLARAGKLPLDPSMEWYSIEAARTVLGYQPQYNFYLQGS